MNTYPVLSDEVPAEAAALRVPSGRFRQIATRARVSNRAGRLTVALAVVGTYVGVGILLRMDPTAYLLLGIPIMLAFQLGIARRPIRALWLIDGRPFRLRRTTVVIAVTLAVVPVIQIVSGVLARDLWVTLYGVAAMAGAAPAAYAIGALDGVSRRALVRSILTAGLVGNGFFLLAALGAGKPGLLANPSTSLFIFAFSLLQYVPIVFVLEEVFFRGLLDTYVRGPELANDRTSSLFISAMWGFWHLPTTFPTGGLSALPPLLVFHTLIGALLTYWWRRSGNLAVPGVTHALIDAVRNALLVV